MGFPLRLVDINKHLADIFSNTECHLPRLQTFALEVPSYLIVAGLVFTTLTVPFLRSEFGEEWECEAGRRFFFFGCMFFFFHSLSSISCSNSSFLRSKMACIFTLSMIFPVDCFKQ